MRRSQITAGAVWLCAAALAAAEAPRLVLSPTSPTDSQMVRATVLGESTDACGAEFLASVDPEARRVTLTGYAANPPAAGCPFERWASEAVLGHLAAGSWTVVAQFQSFPSPILYAETVFQVAASPTVLELGSFPPLFRPYFEVEVDWRDPWTGELRRAAGTALSDRAVQFWFFDPGLPEVTVKILDGQAINGHHWLFASSMTSVEFRLSVTPCFVSDPHFCTTPKEYHSPPGANLDVADVEALP